MPLPFNILFGNMGPNMNPPPPNDGGAPEGADPGPAAPKKRKPRPKKPRKFIKNGKVRTLVNILVTVIVGAIFFYVKLPALNPQAEEFYFFGLILCATYGISAILTSGFQTDDLKGYFQFLKKQCIVPFALAVLLLAIVVVGSLSSWVVLRAHSYSELLPLENGDFAAEVKEISYDQIPMLDAASAERLGNRKLGELSDMVSQFEIIPAYTQINYQGRPVRVTSLAYGDLIKWITNRSDGLPAYIIIDMVTQEAEVVRLPEGMKYTTAEHFGRHLQRHLRFHYPTMMFDYPVFEIDEEGTPYWICSRIVKKVGLFGGVDVHGAVLVNAVTGESKYYEDVPNWVDRVYSYRVIMDQYDYYGRYHNGFINSFLGQRDVTRTTQGWNYIAMNGDVYMYTGVTSVTSDQSNIGFILSNQRTKETRFYPIAGATEASAQESAQSQVQQMRYEATFPLLLNVADQPTYFSALKGADGLVKMYAMVNVERYNIVKTGSTLAECEENYRKALVHEGLIGASDAEIEVGDHQLVPGTVADVRSAVIDGNTYYFFSLTDGTELYFRVSAAENPQSVIMNAGDEVEIGLDEADLPKSGIVDAESIEYQNKDVTVDVAPVEKEKPAEKPAEEAEAPME